jgi:hypothetical protein
MSSKVFNIYGMRSKGEFPKTYLDLYDMKELLVYFVETMLRKKTAKK